MVRNVVSKVMWVGRATVLFVGLVAILALLLGVATTALGATGGNFILGKGNAATTPTSLVSTLADAAKSALIVNNKSGGAALDIRVQAGKPPLKVNSSGKVANLNADKLDGKDSTEFYAAGSKVADSSHADQADNSTNAGNADTVDGKHAAEFASTAHNHDDRYYTKPESDGRYLGKTAKAADSDRLDGLDSTQFVQGRGQALHGARAVPQNSGGYFTVLATQTPDLLVGYTCPADLAANGVLVFINHSSETLNVFSDNGSINPNDYRQLAPNGGRFDQAAAASGEHVTFQVQGTSVATIEVFTAHRANDCHTQAQALITRP